MHIVLCTGIDDHQLAVFYHLVVQVVVESLTMLRENRREGHAPAFGQGDSFHDSDDFLLDPAHLDIVAGDGVHLVAKSAGIIDLLDLALFLHEPHRDDGAGKAVGGLFLDLCHRDARQIGNLQGVVPAGRREIVYRSALGDGSGDHIAEFPGGSGVQDSDPGGERGNRRLRTHPDDVSDFDIVGKNGLFSRVEVDHCRIAGNIQSEIIKP